jgi:hypothetical protein
MMRLIMLELISGLEARKQSHSPTVHVEGTDTHMKMYYTPAAGSVAQSPWRWP